MQGIQNTKGKTHMEALTRIQEIHTPVRNNTVQANIGTTRPRVKFSEEAPRMVVYAPDPGVPMMLPPKPPTPSLPLLIIMSESKPSHAQESIAEWFEAF